MDWIKAPDLQKEIKDLVKSLEFKHVKHLDVSAFRSFGSKSRATARIWGLPRIWQKALNLKPHYCLEVISEKFNKLTADNQKRVLIHELLHIPKNFTGSLLPHRYHRHRINPKTVEAYFRKIKCE